MSASPPPTCPFLGLAADPHSVSAGPSEEHRCYAGARAQSISEEHQRQFCLSSRHPQCPRYAPHGTPARAPQTVVFSPDVADPAASMQSGEAASAASAPSPWLDRLVVLVAVGAVLFAVFYFGALIFERPPAAAPAPAARTATPASATATHTATATGTPRPTATPLPPRPSPVVLPSGARVDAIVPLVDGAGWVSSAERAGNRLGDRYIEAGILDGVVYLGMLQFDLSAIPAGARVLSATLELTGARADELGSGGNWQIRVLNVPANTRWSTLNFDTVRAIPWDYTLQPALSADALGKDKVNRIELPPQALAGIEKQLGQGKFSLRIDGPLSGPDDLFAWESGLGGSAVKPVLRLATASVEQTAKTVVLTCVPTPQNPAAARALGATATAVARAFGTPTPYPPNYMTQVPVTATPTPDSIFAAATAVARATYAATAIGTATPTPPNWVVVQVVTATPEPENEATAVYRAAVATAVAATTGTPTPLPCYVSVAPTSTATPIVAYDLPSATPTVRPTETPGAIPDLLRGKIGFLSDREGTPAAYVMEPDGSRVGKLTNRWAYDFATLRQREAGDFKLVVVAHVTGATRVELLDSANRRVRILVENGAFNYDPVFAPNGKDILLVSTISGHDEIYRMTREDEQWTQLTESTWEWNKRPAWSPDGAHIAWWSNRVTGRKQIWVMNADGSDPINISRNDFNDWDPVWFR